MADDHFTSERRELIKRGEGCITHMYLDTVGKVTVGVGNMLPSADAAAELPFHNRETGEAASADEIRREYETVARQEKGRAAPSYKQFTRLDLDEDSIHELLDSRIADFESGLRRDFPDYDSYPDPARLSLMDMAFNLGNSGLVNKFPSFTRAARAGDWAGCAAECERPQLSAERNNEIRSLLESIA